MDDLTRVLCDYAYDNLLENSYGIRSRKIQRENQFQAERRLDRLCAAHPELREELEDMLEELSMAAGEDMDAAFTCGLKVGLALR